MSKSVILFRESKPEPKLNATPWTRIDGTNPQTVTMINYQSEDGKKIAGTWVCTPGKWAINYDRWEYCHFQEGYSIVTCPGKQPVHLRAGDIFVIEPGTVGTWEVVETVRKQFIFAS